MKLFTQFKLFFPIFFISLMICTGETFAQPSTANYTFTHAANGSLTDMSTGTTELIGPNSSTTLTQAHSVVQSIGFNYVFMGQLYTQFGVSSRGTFRLGSNSLGAISGNNLNTLSAGLLPLIAPFWDAMGTSSTGKVHYKTIGDAPNRVLVVEWMNMRIAVTGSTGADGTFQLRLYETTGKVEFVYGSMNIGTGSPVVTASIGFTTGNEDNKLLSVTDIAIPAVTTVAANVNNSLVNSSTPGPIAGLHSTNQGERVIYTFTPPSGIPDAPTNLTFTNIGDNSLTLNWTDNATNESGYLVENINDGISYILPANSTFFEATNLSLQTNYTFRVYAVTEAAISTGLEGSQVTTNVNNVLTTASYAFTHAANGSLTDMSSGAAELIGSSNATGTSGLRNIGFNFVFMGTMHTQFGVSARGVLRLGGDPSNSGANSLNTTGNLPIITPFWDNIGTSSTGGVRSKVTGTAPNRVLTVEWLNMNIALTGSTTADGTFQLRLYETTGKIEFVYGEMNIGTGSPVVTASIGFTTGNSVDNLLSLRSISPPIVSAVPLGVNNNLVNSSTPGTIAGLHSTSQGERVIFTFTPPSEIPNAPTNLTFTNIGDNSLTLNWTDNAANESGYFVENVNDGIIYPFLPANSTFFEATNLSLQTNYTFRVYAVTKATISTALEGSEATTNDNNLLTSARYSFSHSMDGTLTDMTGATEVIGADNTTGTVGNIDIGFDFYFMSQKHSKFGVTARGVFRFGEGTPGNTGTNTLNTTASNLLPVVTPFWDEIGTSSTGAVRYKLTGIAPDRVLTIEWFNMKISQTSTTADGTFQLRLYENSLKIEFVYGEMNIGAGSAIVTSSIGFSTGNANNNLLSIRSISPAIVSYVTAGVNNNLVNSSEAGPIAGLHSTSQGERVVFSFTPPPRPETPFLLTFSGVGPYAMTLNWIAGVFTDYFNVYRSTDGINFTFDGSTIGTSYNATGLTPETNYTWRIFSNNLTGPSIDPLEGSQSTTVGHNFISGLKTVGPSADFATLTEAFNTIGLSGAAILELQPGYNPVNEAYPISIRGIPGTSDTNTLTIRPAAGVTGINFESDGLQTFKLDSTSYITIDGRPGGILDRGSSSEITISNTNTSGNAILFINGASNNTIKYCKVDGVNMVGANIDGVIAVSSQGGPTGNNDNTIENCEVRDGTTIPVNLIFVGSGVTQNNRFSIINCNLFNFSSAAIHIRSSGVEHKIIGNSIYNTITNAGLGNIGIRFFPSAVGQSHIVSGNFIGGSDLNCGGDPFIASAFTGIYFSGNNSLINNNTIQNINSGTGNFIGVDFSASGNASNIVTGNTIGHNTIPNSILSASTVFVWGIRMSSVETLVTDNLIANITSTGTGTSTQLAAMQLGGSLNSVIKNNTIHSLISNSSNTEISVGSAVTGIAFHPSTLQIGPISGNTIYGLTSIPGGTGTANTSVIGIIVPGGDPGSESVITDNRIFNLNNASAGTSPNIFGIITLNRNGIVSNNQIAIDNGGSPNPINIHGINVNVIGTENIWNIYYNSVNIGGSIFAGALVSSAFYKQNTNTVNLRNNLFYNERTGGTGGHYAVAFENNTNVTSDYNLFVGTSNVALWGATPYNFADYKTNSGLDGFSYSTDPTTVTTANLFTDTPNGNLNINASNNAAYYVDGKGIAIEGISGDFTDSTGVRNTLITQGTTDIGSDEFEYTGTIPDLTASGPPAPSTTTTYSFAGRELGSIMWGSGGTVPTSVSAKYFSGYNPPGILVGEYSKGYWDFTPTGGAGFTYDITLNYTPAILHNIANENNLKMAKYDGEPWLYFPDATVNTTNKTVTKTGLTSFSAFTLTSSEDPLPVELTSFTASIDRRDVYLSWTTASEINNSGFDIERSNVKGETSNEWSKITFINGNGTTSEMKNYTFTDRGLNTGKYNYRLKQIDYNGNFEYFNLSNEVIIGVPDKYNLSQNYPNPFNPVTKINFDLPFDSKVTMKIFDITGREIATLVNDVQPAGYYTVTFDAKNIASGMYFYRIIAEGGNQNYVMTKKMAVIK